MSRVIGGNQARGSISIVTRLDLHDVDLEHRSTVIGELARSLDAGSTVEIIVADLGEDAAATAQHLNELVASGVHVKLCGAPGPIHDWLIALRGA